MSNEPSIFPAILLIASGSASATTLVDGSFETPNLGAGNYSYTTQCAGR